MGSRRDILKYILIAAWLGFTVVFALWWLRFSMSNVSLLAKLAPADAVHWGRQRRMIKWEGVSWIILLIIGGGALTALVERERWRARRVREFFASFSHEVKTSLASLRIQAEALKEEVARSPILDRLVGDTVRLQLQLENSLFLSSHDDIHLVIQRLRLKELVERMGEQWPELKIHLQGDAVIRGDERAMRTVLSNLFQNAIVHGGATEVTVSTKEVGQTRVTISLQDNGRGFGGCGTERLGQLFHRPKATSGSGIGLYICRLLMRKMNGDLKLSDTGHGFHALITAEGITSAPQSEAVI